VPPRLGVVAPLGGVNPQPVSLHPGMLTTRDSSWWSASLDQPSTGLLHPGMLTTRDSSWWSASLDQPSTGLFASRDADLKRQLLQPSLASLSVFF